MPVDASCVCLLCGTVCLTESLCYFGEGLVIDKSGSRDALKFPSMSILESNSPRSANACFMQSLFQSRKPSGVPGSWLHSRPQCYLGPVTRWGRGSPGAYVGS